MAIKDRDYRSRALRRNLRKQARKGQLTSREKKELLEQEAAFRDARRARAPIVGGALAALGGALTIPGVQTALGGGMDRLRQMLERGDISEDEANMVETEKPSRAEEALMERRGVAPSATDVEKLENRGLGEMTYSLEKDNLEELRKAQGEYEALQEEARERANRAKQRAEAAKQAGVDAAIERGLGGPETMEDGMDPAEYIKELANDIGLGRTVGVGEEKFLGTTMSENMFTEADDKLFGKTVTDGGFYKEDFDPTRDLIYGNIQGSPGQYERGQLALGRGDFKDRGKTDYTGGFEFLPADEPIEAIGRRPATTIAMDRPDPLAGSTLDPRLVRALEFFRQNQERGGMVSKKEALMKKIRAKYGIR